MPVRVRFAPSPSGDLHVGNARTALFNWLYAKKEGGTLIFRVEDTDMDRSGDEAIEAIVKSLEWLGLKADEGYPMGGPFAPYRQSQRLPSYMEASEVLIAAGRAYWCYDSEAELEAERTRALNEPGQKKKRHSHRDFAPSDIHKFEAEGRKPSLRFATDDLKGTVAWNDAVRGEVSFDLDEIRDFAIIKSDGTPMYNFANVCDDHAMQVSHVIRGEDGISNTPRQLLLYKALGWEAPHYAHVSFILGPDGQKLSKRHGDTSIQSFRDKGYLPEALLNYLGLLGLGGEGEGEEIFSLEQLVQKFSLDRLIRKSSVFDYGKLDFLNGHYLKHKAAAELAVLAKPFMAGIDKPADWQLLAIEAVKGNAVKLADFPGLCQPLLPGTYTATPEIKTLAVGIENMTSGPQALLEALKAGHPADAEAAKVVLKAAMKASGQKGKGYFLPVRLALTGHEHGPELYNLLPLMDGADVLRRLGAFVALGN
jgi:nondiscriminating glutamyl-tRNA synthetase